MGRDGLHGDGAQQMWCPWVAQYCVISLKQYTMRPALCQYEGCRVGRLYSPDKYDVSLGNVLPDLCAEEQVPTPSFLHNFLQACNCR